MPLYTKSPGGVFATAERTESFRPLVEDAVDGSGFDADLVEAMVFLESGGRPDVIAGDDPVAASGLTQILAETGQNFLGMDVDLDESRKLTVRIASAAEDAEMPPKPSVCVSSGGRSTPGSIPSKRSRAPSATSRTARERLGRDDLAVVSYHMGIGNLSNVLRAYAPGADLACPTSSRSRISPGRASSSTPRPTETATAHELLTRLGDDSPTYYWRVLAAQEIMRLYRDDPDRLQELDLLHAAKASHEEVLHPPSETERFADATDLQRAWDDSVAAPATGRSRPLGFAVDRTMGELAPPRPAEGALSRPARGSTRDARLHRGARPGAERRDREPLEVTSTVRDDAYQELLRDGNPEATHGYSLHTTGYRVRRSAALRVRRSGAGVPVPARRPHRARPDRVDPRAGGDPHRGGARTRSSAADSATAARSRTG